MVGTVASATALGRSHSTAADDTGEYFQMAAKPFHALVVPGQDFGVPEKHLGNLVLRDRDVADNFPDFVEIAVLHGHSHSIPRRAGQAAGAPQW
jgi:hypothetical protein